MNRRGFTLVEVITAIVIMSAMMVAVIGFVDYSGTIWQRGNAKISAKNYTRLTFDTLKDDLNRAKEVARPVVGDEKPYLDYSIGNKKYMIELMTGKDILYKNDLLSGTSAKQVLARSVNKFNVNRISTWTLQISISIYDDLGEEGSDANVISSETMIITVPGLS